MTHPEHIQLMHLVLDGEATPGESQDLAHLLASDPAARAQYDDLQRLFDGLKAVPKAFPPAGLVSSVMASLPADSPARPGRQTRVRQLFSRPSVIGATSTEVPDDNYARYTKTPEYPYTKLFRYIKYNIRAGNPSAFSPDPDASPWSQFSIQRSLQPPGVVPTLARPGTPSNIQRISTIARPGALKGLK